MRVLNVAHRGASAHAPENTLAAVREGIARGSDLVELDVQRSKDGQLVLVHDATLVRTTNVAEVFPHRAPWRVADFTYAELQLLDAGSWKSNSYAGERIPSLAQAVEAALRYRGGLLLELKAPGRYPGIEADVVQVLRRFPCLVAAGRLVVQSFDVDAMWRLRCIEPAIPVGLLGRPTVAELPGLASWASLVNPHHRTVGADYVAEVQRLGMDCLVWTVNGVRAMRRALGLGVDGIITDRPDLLGQVLHARMAPAA